MQQQLLTFMRSPRFGDRIKNYRAALLNAISWALVLTTLIAFLLIFPFSEASLQPLLLTTVIPFILIGMIALLLLRQARVQQAGFLLSVGMWAGISVLLFQSVSATGALSSSLYQGYLIPILLASFAVSVTAGVWAAFLSGLMGIILLSIELGQGPLTPEFRGQLFSAFVTQMSQLLLTTLLVQVVARHMQRSLLEATASEEKLATQNEQLSSVTTELKRSNQELEQFAYVVSHDLKAPLRGINNLATWIEEDLQDIMNEDNREQMDLLRQRVTRMENLIDGILTYSRAGRRSESYEDVDVGLLLEELVDSLAPQASFHIEIGEGMPTIRTEPVKLHQVFANLLSNGIKYHDKPDGRVWVEVAENGRFYTFSVSDNGPGIAPEYHEKIFDVFQTLQAKDSYESTGVGLAVVKKIVENHGGKIEVDSTVGKGTTFTFTWPKQIEEKNGEPA